MIKNSLDWTMVRYELRQQISLLPYDPSPRKMLTNIDALVTDLSKMEVDARRTRITHYTDAKLAEINGAIETLEKLVVLALLLR